jgi:hypothetical protein
VETLTSDDCPNCNSPNTSITGLIIYKYLLKRYAGYIKISPHYLRHYILNLRFKFRWNVSQLRINKGEFDRDNLEKQGGLGLICGNCRKTIKTPPSFIEGQYFCSNCLVTVTSRIPNQKGKHTGKIPYIHVSRKQLAEKYKNRMQHE